MTPADLDKLNDVHFVVALLIMAAIGVAWAAANGWRE